MGPVKPAVMSNHIGAPPTSLDHADVKPLLPVFENHVSPQHGGGAQATARHLLARVGIGGPESGDPAAPSIGPALLSAGLAGMRPVTDEKRPGSAPYPSSARHTPHSAAAAAMAAFPDVFYDDYEVCQVSPYVLATYVFNLLQY